MRERTTTTGARAWLVVGMAAVAVAGAACSNDTTTGTTDGTTVGTTAGGVTGTTGTTGAGGGSTPGTAAAPAATEVLADSIIVADTDFGPALATGEDQVVYLWEEETDTTPMCTEDLIGEDGTPCAEKWPAVAVEGADAVTFEGVDSSMFEVVDVGGGRQQLAVNGHLLYTMSLDGPGEANCQGAEGWYILNPDGTTNTTV